MKAPRHGMTPDEIEAYQKRFGKGPHLAADLAVVSLKVDNGVGQPMVLLVKRAHDPYQGLHALPGGFIEYNEDLEHAARRELAEETGLRDLGSGYIEQLHAFGRPERDPRGRVLTVVYMALVPWHELVAPEGGDDAAEARFWLLKGSLAVDDKGEPLKMAFDHDSALAFLRKRMVELAAYSSAPMLLLPPEFTMAQAQKAYEALLDTRLEPNSFRGWLERQGWMELVERSRVAEERADQRYRLRIRKASWAPGAGRPLAVGT